MPGDESRDVEARGGAVDTDTSRYRRDRVTWAVFAALFAFGLLNAGLGPALPYLRDAEHLSYLGGVLHQVAFAIGGGIAGVATARAGRLPGRERVIRVGLLGAGAAWLAVGYGNTLAISVTAALLVSMLATAALVRLWAVLADVHGTRRTVAMAEGEVAVSFGGIVCPLLISAIAATALESIPPERKAPTGTSAIIWPSIELVSRRFSSSTVPSSPAANSPSSCTAGCQ